MLLKPILLALTSLALLTGPTQAQSWSDGPSDSNPLELPAPPLAERIYGLSTLWSEAKFSFAFFHQVPDLDWDAAYQRFIPRVAEAETLYAYYRELQAFVALLKDGHTDVTMPRPLRFGSVPLWIELIDDRYFVARSEKKLVDRIPVGSEIVAVRGLPVTEFAAKEVDPYIAQSSVQAREMTRCQRLLTGLPDELVPFTIMTPDGERREVKAATSRSRRPRLVPPLPSFRMKVEWPAEGIAKVMLMTFADGSVPERFEKLLPELEKARAIILDLRFNGGGDTRNGKGVLRHFTDRNLDGATWSTREHRAANRVWGTYRSDGPDAYARLDKWTEPVAMSPLRVTGPGRLVGRPLAVLTSPRTASAAEDFLIYADQLDHVKRVGRPTMGTTGQPLSLKLPGGGFARICTKRDTWADGSDFVGPGIVPHISVLPTLEDFLSGRDRTLEVAIEHLQATLGAR